MGTGGFKHPLLVDVRSKSAGISFGLIDRKAQFALDGQKHR